MKTLHLICNAHIDPIWQWTWDEGISAAIATFKSAADLADEYDYVFCHGEALLYETIEKNAPDLFGRICDLAKKGKWHISGGWYLQPDCLMPSGETIIRNIVVGQKYFAEKFGAKPFVATNYDSFGHSVGLVQIMAKTGYKGYLICRPRKDVQIKYPSRFFKWISPDGSSVIVSNSSTYNSALGKVTEKIINEVTGEESGMLGSEKQIGEKRLLQDVDYVLWGVGNHGGGPSRKDLTDIKKLKIDGVKIIHSSPESLFSDKIEVGGEKTTSLVTCMPGCYSSMMRVKQAFRRTENLLYATEKMLYAAILGGMKVDLSARNEAEKKLLLASFHDILPGTCVEDGEREGFGLLASCEKTMRDYRTAVFSYLVMYKDKAKEGEYPIFVFNYQPYASNAVIESEFSLADQNWSDEEYYVPHVFDENGNELVCQQVKEESTLNLDWRKKIVFEGSLKPFGITRFTVRTEPKSVKNKFKVYALSGDESIKKRVSLAMYDDTADPWAMSEEELKSLGKNPKEFMLMNSSEAACFCGINGEIPPVRVIEDGSVLKTTEALYSSSNSKAVVQVKEYKNQSYTDIKVILEYADKNKLIRVKIPVPEKFIGGKVVGDGLYVWEEKPNSEFTFQKWVGVKKNDEVFAVLNDGIYGGMLEDGYLCLTLVRGAGYCFHPIPNRSLYPEDRYLPRIDCGRYVYNFRIVSGDISSVVRQAEEFNSQPYAVNIFPTGGNEVKENGLEISENIRLTSVVPKENGDAILRLYNPSETAEVFNLKIGNAVVSCKAEKFEILCASVENGVPKIIHGEFPD